MSTKISVTLNKNKWVLISNHQFTIPYTLQASFKKEKKCSSDLSYSKRVCAQQYKRIYTTNSSQIMNKGREQKKTYTITYFKNHCTVYYKTIVYFITAKFFFCLLRREVPKNKIRFLGIGISKLQRSAIILKSSLFEPINDNLAVLIVSRLRNTNINSNEHYHYLLQITLNKIIRNYLWTTLFTG